ncbi:transposase [Thermosynechococcus sp. HN-54]|uniref:RNA-guided endonuclease InsQ/TnpB family protein n=1 Tax=Thermosynechococcus sp. HN-54 TaxID=2933959 RepID=UPI0028F40569|nr:transposase [Thermosynechococcus sp. HN-54]
MKNYAKTRLQLAKTHYRIACIRNDALHKLTSYLVKNHGRVVIEGLNVGGMLKNPRLARTIADIRLYEIRRQLTYKCELYGSELVVVDRWYPKGGLRVMGRRSRKLVRVVCHSVSPVGLRQQVPVLNSNVQPFGSGLGS